MYPPTASPITKDGPVLKEENCLFPWGRLSCLKMTAQEIAFRDPLSLTLTASYLRPLKTSRGQKVPCCHRQYADAHCGSSDSTAATVVLTPLSVIMALAAPPTSTCIGCVELEEARCCKCILLWDICWDTLNGRRIKQSTKKRLLDFTCQLLNGCNFKRRLWSCLFTTLLVTDGF